VLKVAVVSDVDSYSSKDALLIFLAGQDCDVLDLGVDAADEESSAEELTSRIASAFREGNCNCCIGLSRTGNSFQIRANKYDFIRAAPCIGLSAIDEMPGLNINMCDISARLPLGVIVQIAEAFLRAFGQQ
jgi:ribose 5-phosphate isomerase RpiB